LEDLLQRHHRQLREAARSLATTAVVQPTSETTAMVETSLPRPATRAEQEKAQRHQRRQMRYDQVRELHTLGFNQSDIGRTTGLSRKTIRTYLHAESCPQYPDCRRAPPRLLAPFEPYLKQRWEAGCHNAAELFREIKAKGFAGQRSIVKDYLRQWRARLPEAEQRTSGVVPRVRARDEIPSPRCVRWWLLGRLNEADPVKRAWQESFVGMLRGLCPDMATVQPLAARFVTIVKARAASEFEEWLTAARSCPVVEMRLFAKGIEQDKAAVLAALTHEWSNGPVECQVNRLKTLKRSMYGRGSFSLLRARVLSPSKVA